MKRTLSELPDVAQSFGRLKTLLELEEKVNTESIFGYSIKQAFIDKKNPLLIIRMIKDQLKDGRNNIENCIPKWIVEDIIKYWPE